jgi:hypothetical protein
MNANQTGTREEVLHDLLLTVGQIRESIGQLRGAVQAIRDQRQETIRWMSRLDRRLRFVERKAAINGLIAGGIMTMIMGLAGYFFRFQAWG